LSYVRRNIHGDESSNLISLSLPFPLNEGKATSDGVGVEMLCEFASCHAGMEGPTVGIGVDGILGIVDPRLRSKAFRDFNS